MCGIVGVVGTSAVNQRIYDALTVLQHRGQDAAGIATYSDGELYVRKESGLVRDVFQQRHMLELKGNAGIGHVRYPTAGCASASEAQPFYVNSPYGICLAHNGNLTNATELAEVLTREDRRHLNTTSDSEVLLNVFASELQRIGTPRITPADVFAALNAVYRRCRGGYAAVAMIIGHGILGFRDPNGIRPLVLGQDVHVREVGDRRVVRESPAEPDLGTVVVQADDALRAAHEMLHGLARAPLRPVRLREECVHGVDVDPGRIVVQLVAALEPPDHPAWRVRSRKPPCSS